MSEPDHAALSARITELEIAVTHQQHLLQQLNEVVTEQTQEQIRLKRELGRLEGRVEEIKEREESEGGDLPNERPPHY